MAKTKQKYYTVWEGRQTGVFDSWEACKEHVQGHESAKYKSFATEEEAREAYRMNYWQAVKNEKKPAAQHLSASSAYIHDSIAVDAACSGNPGKMEYRGVCVKTGQQLFHHGPLERGTNNIGEFLAIVHALAWMKQNKIDLPLYTDSANAILWVKNKKCKTKLEPVAANAPVFQLIDRAEKWLQENTYTTRIIKWETKLWGEIPADFGRK